MPRSAPTDRGPRLSILLPTLLVGLLALLAPAAAGAKVPASFFGTMAVNPSHNDFKRMGEAGLGAYRFGLNWRAVQPTRRGGYHWGGIDAIVHAAATNGLQPQPVLIGTPRYVHKGGVIEAPVHSREDRRAWKDFLAAAADRYGPGGQFWLENPTVPPRPLRQWIVWNEQNAVPYWSPRPNAREYAQLVKISDEAISSVDPEARMVLGGMYGYPRYDAGISAKRFLRELYRVPGIEDHFDAVSLHPYGSGTAAFRRQVEDARAVMRRAGDGEAGILIGEFGWASRGPDHSPIVVGKRGQARRIRGAMKLVIDRRRRWNIIGAYVYLWRDFDAELACTWCPYAGLLTKRGREKPALRALEQVIAAIR